MDFELSEEQAEFRKVMQRFVAEQISPVAAEWERTSLLKEG